MTLRRSNRLRSGRARLAATIACFAFAESTSAQVSSAGQPVDVYRRTPLELSDSPPPQAWLARECPTGEPHRFKVGDHLIQVRLTPQFVSTPRALERIIPTCPPIQPPSKEDWYFTLFPNCETAERRFPRECEIGGDVHPYWYWTQVRGLPHTVSLTRRVGPPTGFSRPDVGDWREEVAGVQRLWRNGRPWDVFLAPRLEDPDNRLGPIVVRCGGVLDEQRSASGRLCSVGFDGVEGLSIFYRFSRDVFEVPDFSVLDLRFRRWLTEILGESVQVN